MSTPRDDILDCACQLYMEQGREGFSMRRLARSVGVTAPALYRHFDGKDEVLAAVLGEAFKVLSQYLYRALSGPTPLARMIRAGDAYLDFALDHPRFYEVIHAPKDLLECGELPQGILEQAHSIGRFWNDRLREVMEAGEMREADPNSVSLTMWAHAHGLISLYLRGMLGPMEADAFRRVYRESFLRVMEGVATDDGIARAGEGGEGEDDGTTSNTNGASVS